jgi:hypothetical protein
MSRGIIYLIQPSELVGTNRYKIGMSNNPDLERCKKGYKKGSRYLCIMECNNPLILEENIKKVFNEKFKLIAGNEYFEGNEKNILITFNNLVMEYHKSDNNYVCNIKDHKINDYTKMTIISKNILIEKKYDDKIGVKYRIIKELFDDLLYGGVICENFKNFRIKCTNEYYDNIINNFREERDEDEKYKICNYMLAYKNIIIQIFNKNFDEDNTEFKMNIGSKSFCEFLGYYDINFSFLTSEYIIYIIQLNREKYKYFEIIKENNNKYSGILVYNTEREPEFISNIDLDYNYINTNYSHDNNDELTFYYDCKKYINENDCIKEHFEGHLDNWNFCDISDHSLYTEDSAEFKKIIYPLIINSCIQKVFSQKIISLIQNNIKIVDKFRCKDEIKKIKKYKNLKLFIKQFL